MHTSKIVHIHRLLRYHRQQHCHRQHRRCHLYQCHHHVGRHRHRFYHLSDTEENSRVPGWSILTYTNIIHTGCPIKNDTVNFES